jgi:hypothetical protein
VAKFRLNFDVRSSFVLRNAGQLNAIWVAPPLGERNPVIFGPAIVMVHKMTATNLAAAHSRNVKF